MGAEPSSVGINSDELIVGDDDIYGDGVTIAQPGGICISAHGGAGHLKLAAFVSHAS